MRNENSSAERGQSLIEFTISMVLVLFLLTGLVDLGRAIFAYMALRDSAQEGATFGSVNPADTAAIESRVFGSSSMLKSLWDQFGNSAPIVIEINTDGDACLGDEIQVVVTYDEYPLTMPFVGAFLGKQSFDITASASDTILSPQCD